MDEDYSSTPILNSIAGNNATPSTIHEDTTTVNDTVEIEMGAPTIANTMETPNSKESWFHGMDPAIQEAFQAIKGLDPADGKLPTRILCRISEDQPRPLKVTPSEYLEKVCHQQLHSQLLHYLPPCLDLLKDLWEANDIFN